VPLVKRPLLLRCKTSIKHCPVSAPLTGSQQPSDGLFSPMEVRTNHLPMCTGPSGTCPSGMVLHIKNYALHGLISHRDHSNVNHISSLIFIKHMHKNPDTSFNSSKTLQKSTIQDQRKGRHPIGLVFIRDGKFPGRFHPSHVNEVMWLGDVQTSG
jgi:hypothetical protein